MNDLFQLRLAPSNLLLLVVPALYTLKSVLATRWFGQSHPMEVSATLAVGSVFLLSPTLISRGFVRECGELWEHVSAGDLVAFGLGTLSGTVLGGAFYIMALARSEGQYAYVTAFNLLIPAISGMLAAAFAWVLHGGHAAPDVVQWVCIGLLLLVLGRFTILNQRAQVPPMRESAQQPPKSLE